MSNPQDKGRDFEKEMSNELGLDRVPGSGSQWWSKLDLKGRTARWSLKFTEKKSYRLTQLEIDEATDATQGLSGDGAVPLMLIRIGSPEYDLVMIRKNDFLAWQEGEISFASIEQPKKSDIRRARSKIPVLLREEEDGTD